MKRNTDTSRIEARKSITTAIVCRDDQCRIQFQSGKFFDDWPTSLTEKLAIREALIESIQLKSSLML